MEKSDGHYTFAYYDVNGNKHYKAKKGYNTQEQAVEIARKMNLFPQTVHKYSAYKCSVCHKWHIGKNKYKTITEEFLVTNKDFLEELLNFDTIIASTDDEVVLSSVSSLVLEKYEELVNGSKN